MPGLSGGSLLSRSLGDEMNPKRVSGSYALIGIET